MSHRRIRVAIMGSIMVAGWASSAHAGMHLSLVGLGNFTTPTYTYGSPPPGITYGFNGTFGPGGGLLLSFPMSYRTEFELGALYVTHSYDYKFNSTTASFKYGAVEVPIILRYWLSRHFSMGVGGFVDSGINQVTFTPPGGSAMTESFGDASLRNLDYGIVGSIGLRLPLSMAVSFMLDGRYQYGLANMTTNSGDIMKFADLQGLAGFRFAMGLR